MRSITLTQLYMFFAQFLFSTTIGFFLSPLVREAGFTVWVSILLGTGIGLLITYFSYLLSIRRPERFLGQYGREILGRWIHYPLFTATIFVNMFIAAFILRQLVAFLVQNYLLGTPFWAIALLFGICISQGVRAGAPTMFRSAQGLFLISIVSAVSFPLFVTSQLNYDMAIAFITNLDLPGSWNGAVMIASLFSEAAFIVYIFPLIQKEKAAMKPVIWASLTAAVITIANMMTSVLLFGVELTGNFQYPALEIVRYIHSSAIFENLDPLFIVFWLYSMFFKIAMFLLIAVMGLTHMIGLKDHKPFSYLMTAAMIFMTVYMNLNSAQLDEITSRVEASFLLFPTCVPIIYLVVDSIRSSIRGNGGGI
ncbi:MULTISPECIES: GerAB/ArcD/ProY family transporter [unclassified Paenibacillus]|uniref:GerAB/ArcD/ProY family transporter n=1 Tax=unclassified Paenibacillus TaxID=185978 RepID=UPI00240697F7|nr:MULTISPECIES: GerAB/ArcD/ProY family transporter [unclassified Paenibacillus]MDF9839050.1 spore germination protein KB [Paenibacillus sp. PastF-2]MDF9845632.1 spore germination protein KB [Paenibacillus sp. PastM-2]MDF9852204.1 spore germination protein KB [Paenibacillus sp. PastF-1]MDH6478067.1 spore germination protein KB [Paenibacillus sp. PastH-2]MDH6505801.1 spore germination protein KB [Paenibacillus sp. PastM-3]